MKSLRTLLPYFRPYRRGVAVGLALVVIGNVFIVAGPYIVKIAVDELAAGLRPELIRRYAGMIIAVALVGGIARYGMRQLLNGISRRMETDLRSALFDHLMRLPPQFFDGWRTGDLMSRATNDVQAVRMVAGPAIMYAVNTLAVSTFALALMIWIDRSLTLVGMIPMILLPPAVFAFGKRIHQRFERIQSQFSDLSSFVQENLAGARIVKAYAREDAQARRFEELNREYRARNLALARVWGAFHPSLLLLTGLGGIVVLWYGGGQVIRGQISLGDFVAFSFYLTLLMWPMIALGWVTNLFQRGAASMGRLNELFEVEPTIVDSESPIAAPAVTGAIEFEDVTFRYAESDPAVLEHVSFSVEPGQTVAIVGATASGKTTLARLIPRLYDASEGVVRIDGVDVRDLALADLRAAIAFVPQEPFLFSMPLRRNIELRYDGAEEGADLSEGLGTAVDVSQLRKTLTVLPDGIDTRLGERGINLSGGQKQRATLARAVYRDAPILILDDSLSAVDAETETAILQGLRTYMAGRTSLIISHRVSAVREADLILVLEQGQVAERGTHEELIEAGGVYARLLERQLLERELEDPAPPLPAGPGP